MKILECGPSGVEGVCQLIVDSLECGEDDMVTDGTTQWRVNGAGPIENGLPNGWVMLEGTEPQVGAELTVV